MSENIPPIRPTDGSADVGIVHRRVGGPALPSSPPTVQRQTQRPAIPTGNTANQFGTVRDRLFHAMLIRLALRYNERFPLHIRKVIEFMFLFTALIMMSTLLFVHLSFSRSPTTCLHSIKSEWIKDGVVRVEVVKNLKMLERQEEYISWYIREMSSRVCQFNLKDVLVHGPKVMPAELRASNNIPRPNVKPVKEPYKSFFLGFFLSFFYKPSVEHTEESEVYEDILQTDSLELEAKRSFQTHFQNNHAEDEKFEYLYRVEYAWLYGVLRLPPQFREKHGIPTTWVRIDADSECFGDSLTRKIIQSFVGYEDTIVASLREQAVNVSNGEAASSMGFLHDLRTHEHFHFISHMLSKASYFTAALLMLTFTFAISMLLRFSHQQIFIFIIDLLNMFEQQQPLHFPIAPILTVILALVGMEAIMSEVFNDTTTAFYVILIVWMADQYDAIFCFSQISKRYWLRFFYMYQFFFYAYQYRFGSQYGSLALLASAFFILHSMIYFFHHYEMPLILHQERFNQVSSEIHAVPNLGPVEMQTVTVRPSRSTGVQMQEGDSSTEVIVMDVTSTAASTRTSQQQQNPQVDLPSPSSVFDARNPIRREEVVEAAPEVVESPPANAEEQVAHEVVAQVLDELFNSSEA